MQGSSGARIVVYSTYVLKKGDQRVGLQGDWLRRNTNRYFPDIFDVGDDQYTMERLTPLQVKWLDVQAMVPLIEDILAQSCWRKPPVVELDASMLHARVIPTVDTYCSRLRDAALDVVDNLISAEPMLRRVRVHGDPTVDNLMVRPYSGDLILCDPLPATPYAPDLLAVDLGKILQSAAGWEGFRYGFPVRRTALKYVLEEMYHKYGGLETEAAVRYAFVHVVRTLPYVPDDVREQIVNYVLYRLMEVQP